MISNDYIDKKLFLRNAGKTIKEKGHGEEWINTELTFVQNYLNSHVEIPPEIILRLKQVVWYLESCQ